MGRVTRAQRKGAGSAFKSHTHHRERWVRKRTDELAAEEDRLKAEESALDRRA
jgi:hypothetical protein